MRELLLPTKTASELLCSGKEFKSNSHLTTILSKCGKISVELCPGFRNCDVDKLKEIKPSFCSVTWLSTQNYLNNKVESIPAIVLAKRLISHDFEVLLHLTGSSLNKTNATRILDKIKQSGIRNILCLQGNEAQNENFDSSIFPHAIDLVKFIKAKYEDYFCIGVAAYPECHPKATSLDRDLRYLKEKVDAGANFIITQMTFSCAAFNSFYQKCMEYNVNVPIIAGVYVICGYDQLTSTARICGVNISDEILRFIEKHKKDREVVRKYGLSFATKFIRETKHLGISYHIFSLNNLDLVKDLVESLDF